MPLPMPDDANGAAEQGEDDNKVQKRVTSRQTTGLVNEPTASTTRRTTNKPPLYNPGISGSRAAASSQQIQSGPSRITTQVPRRNNKDAAAQPVPSDRL